MVGFQLPGIAFCPEVGLGDVSASQEVLLGWGNAWVSPRSFLQTWCMEKGRGSAEPGALQKG